jgi:hypothetical protein
MNTLGIFLVGVAAMLWANSYAAAAVTVSGNVVTGDGADNTIIALAFGNRALIFADGQSLGIVDVSSGLTVDGGAGTDLFLLLGRVNNLTVKNVERDLSSLFGGGNGGGGNGGGGNGNGDEEEGDETEDSGDSGDSGSDEASEDGGNGGILGNGGLFGGGSAPTRLGR